MHCECSLNIRKYYRDFLLLPKCWFLPSWVTKSALMLNSVKNCDFYRRTGPSVSTQVGKQAYLLKEILHGSVEVNDSFAYDIGM